MNEKSIFAATLVSFDPNEEGFPASESRNCGWYQELNDLLEGVKKHGSSLFECRWDYLVIEERYEGLGYRVKREWEIWMKFNDENKTWEKCNKPTEAVGICWCCC